MTTNLMLRAGAPIHDLNAVRTPLSLVKAGGLRRAAGEAHVLTLIVSDVLGNDPRVIASGPTVEGDIDAAAALAQLRHYGIDDRVPISVTETLVALIEQPPTPLASTSRDALAVVADNGQAVRAARDAAENAGFATTIAWTDKTGEASSLGQEWVDLCRGMPSTTDVVVGGGEATVTVRGDGVGGRNTEFALAAAFALTQHRHERWIVASLATDGDDGPTRVAGAIAGPETLDRARARGIDPAACLTENDSLRVFEAAGGLVRPGPTGTNVNDIYMAIREEALGRGR
jgi:hydroxypyruvate reductase